MMRSLNSAVAGLRSHQTKMDVIGNNIANVNTYGFKSSRTTFSDVFYQNVSSGSRATSAAGGTNPTQIGYGAAVATVDVMNTVSSAGQTDKPLDVFLAGEGFLVSKDSSGKQMYTRLGNLGFDGEGNLVDGNGQFIQGFPQNADGSAKISADGTITGAELQNIRVDPEILDKLKGLSISKTGSIVGSMPGDPVIKASKPIAPFLTEEKMTVPADSTAQGKVNLIVGALPTIGDLNATSPSLGVTAVEFGDTGLANGDYSIAYDSSTKQVTFKDKAAGGATYTGFVKDGKVTLQNSSNKQTAMTLTLTPPTAAVPTTDLSATGGLKTGGLKYQVTTSDKGNNVVKLPKAGPAAVPAAGSKFDLGGLMDIDVTAGITEPYSGTIANIAPGEEQNINIGNLVLAKFRNSAGMMEAGSSYFEETFNSGSAIFVMPSLEGTGEVNAGNLELSNVDVSKEFTDMITTQRGFQANSRIITVSDSMLEELVNLKR